MLVPFKARTHLTRTFSIETLMACAGGSVVSSEVAVGVKERLESLVDNVKIVRKQIKSNVIMSRNFEKVNQLDQLIDSRL